MKIGRFAIALGCFVSLSLYAADDTEEFTSRSEKYNITYRLNDDGSHTTEFDFATRVLHERAIDSLKDADISYSASIERVEILSAYTRKADGRHLDVPKNNFQLVEHKGKDKDSPVYSDRVRMTIVFPDVAVGDTVVLHYKIIDKEAMFPGKFSVMQPFQPGYPYDDVTIRVDMPSSMWSQYRARGMTEKVVESNGRKVVEWHYENRVPVKNKRSNYTVYDIESDPGYSFSTFRSYQEIAEAYGARALPKAKVTARVQKLADEIAAGISVPREQARLLYEWVATNIDYAGNCIGVGAVVPRDIDFILDNRMGDCKDHATLLQALLAAKGIESTQALINASSLYRLPQIPVVSTVNHVINYIPSLNLYLDSTSQSTPFGMLPVGDIGKPVLLVEKFDKAAYTPIPPVGDNRQIMKSTLAIGEDGSLSGKTTVALNGMYAVTMRDSMRNLPKDAESEMIKNVFLRQGKNANGIYEQQDAKPLLDSFSYNATFDVKEFLEWPGAGAFTPEPILFSAAPVSRFSRMAYEEVDEVDVLCFSGYSREEYLITLPKKMKLLKVPKSFSIKNDFLAYKASYKLTGRTLTIVREMDDRTKGAICSPEMNIAYRDFAKKIVTDLRSQIVYM